MRFKLALKGLAKIFIGLLAIAGGIVTGSVLGWTGYGMIGSGALMGVGFGLASMGANDIKHSFMKEPTPIRLNLAKSECEEDLLHEAPTIFARHVCTKQPHYLKECYSTPTSASSYLLGRRGSQAGSTRPAPKHEATVSLHS